MAGILNAPTGGATRTRIADLVGHTLALKPLDQGEATGPRGDTFDYTNTQTLDLDVAGDGSYNDLGELWVTQMILRERLELCTADNPWIVGKLGMAGRAYILEPLSDSELAVATKLVDQYEEIASF